MDNLLRCVAGGGRVVVWLGKAGKGTSIEKAAAAALAALAAAAAAGYSEALHRQIKIGGWME